MARRKTRKKKPARKGKVPPHLRKHLFKKKRHHHMAKRKKSKAPRKRSRSRKRTHAPQHRKSRRRRSSGGRGVINRFMPSRDDMHLMIGAAAYGWIESRSKSDANFILNKLPRPIEQLGWTGNTAIVLWGAAKVTKNKWLGLAARTAAMVAAYQLGARGKLYDKADEHFTLSGGDDDDVVAAIEAGNRQQLGAMDPYAGAADGGWQGGW